MNGFTKYHDLFDASSRSFAAAMYMAVAICLSPLGGMFSNIVGRRKCFMILTSVGILGYVTLALSPNVAALFVGRFMTIVAASGLSATIGEILRCLKSGCYKMAFR